MSGWVQDEVTLRDLPVSLILGTRFDKYKSQNDRYDDITADKWSSKEQSVSHQLIGQCFIPLTHKRLEHQL